MMPITNMVENTDEGNFSQVVKSGSKVYKKAYPEV